MPSSSQLALLPVSDFTPEEKQQVVEYLFALTKAEIEPFLQERNIPISGTKPQLRERLQEKLDKRHVSYIELVDYIDEIEPWSAHHVYLLDGPQRSLTSMDFWKDLNKVKAYLTSHKIIRFLNKKKPLILPPDLSLSSIQHSGNNLRIIAVERRDSYERQEELDDLEETEDGDEIQYRAYRHIIARGLMIFEWDMRLNTATLQITQLPSHWTYEDAVKRFHKLVHAWLDIGLFPKKDLRPAIGYLHLLEKKKTGEVRSHGIEYVTMSGRKLGGKSASSKDPLLGGEAVIDSALEGMRQEGTGQTGNFFFLPYEGTPLIDPVHVYLLADKERINFPTANPEAAIRHVVKKIRAACVRAP